MSAKSKPSKPSPTATTVDATGPADPSDGASASSASSTADPGTGGQAQQVGDLVADTPDADAGALQADVDDDQGDDQGDDDESTTVEDVLEFLRTLEPVELAELRNGLEQLNGGSNPAGESARVRAGL